MRKLGLMLEGLFLFGIYSFVVLVLIWTLVTVMFQ